MSDEILDTLEPPQREAVNLFRLLIRTYGHGEGTGLFSGVTRYHALEERAKIAAIQSRGLFEFVSRLQRSMLWPSPPKKLDAEFIASIQGDHIGVLNAIANHAPMVIMLARHCETKRKAKENELYDDELPIKSAPEEKPTQTENALNLFEEIKH